MVKIILNREELKMVLGWIGMSQVIAEETRVPWDEFEDTIVNKFKDALNSYSDMKMYRKGNTSGKK